MKTAVLYGREQIRFGEISAVAEGQAAIVLSRGAAQKRYRYTDPNEDCAAFAHGECGTLLVVADGHGGRQAAEVAIDRLLTEHAQRFTGRASDVAEHWPLWGLEALADVNAAILENAIRGGPPESRTTLALAVVRPEENLLACASAADSHIFRVGGPQVVDLARGPSTETVFLGSPAETRESLGEHCVVHCTDLTGVAAVVLASDGFSEAGVGVAAPPSAVADTLARTRDTHPEVQPLEVARSLVEQALDAHRRQSAGDNVATAVWIRRSPAD
jgi:serine/threonine protein phosphatase PrpC